MVFVFVAAVVVLVSVAAVVVAVSGCYKFEVLKQISNGLFLIYDHAYSMLSRTQSRVELRHAVPPRRVPLLNCNGVGGGGGSGV